MIIFVYHFIVNVLVIYGVHTATGHGMILEPVRLFYERKFNCLGGLKSKLAKALFDCTPCMSSIYGVIGFCFLPGLEWTYLPIWVFSLCGFNSILNKIIR